MTTDQLALLVAVSVASLLAASAALAWLLSAVESRRDRKFTKTRIIESVADLRRMADFRESVGQYEYADNLRRHADSLTKIHRLKEESESE
jgi:type II secretory pathway pseudopilin PulG